MLTYQPIFDIISIVCVPVAHPDRALDSDSKGSRFESEVLTEIRCASGGITSGAACANDGRDRDGRCRIPLPLCRVPSGGGRNYGHHRTQRFLLHYEFEGTFK